MLGNLSRFHFRFSIKVVVLSIPKVETFKRRVYCTLSSVVISLSLF